MCALCKMLLLLLYKLRTFAGIYMLENACLMQAIIAFVMQIKVLLIYTRQCIGYVLCVSLRGVLKCR